MPQSCAVPRCRSKESGHRFPKDRVLLQKWITAISLESVPKSYSRVCKKHFVSSDYELPKDSGRKKPQPILKKDAIPKIRPRNQVPSPSIDKTAIKGSGALPRKINILRKKKTNSDVNTDPHNVIGDLHDPIKQYCPTELNKIHVDTSVDTYEMTVESVTKDFTAQCSLCNCTADTSEAIVKTIPSPMTSYRADFRIEYLINKQRELHFYTGFDDYEHFNFVFNLLGEQVNHLKYYPHIKPPTNTRLLSPKNEFFLTMVKLRRNMTNQEIEFRFGISASVAGNVFITWINFLYCQFQELNIWASSKVVEDNLKGEKYHSTVIIDCTEMKIVQPKNPVSQQLTYSSYKSCNTLKVLVGISQTGSVTFVSDAYGGAISDRELFEKCGIINLLENKENIMCDRGFNIQDLVVHKNVTVNKPEFLKKNSGQLTPAQLSKSKQISSKRIHVERVIGLGRTYRILTARFESTQVPLAGRIIFVCFMLTNFRRTI